MTRLKTFAVALALVPVLLLAAARLSDAWPGSFSYMTFSAPVSIPGASLPAGTYVFRRPSDTATNVIQVMSRDYSRVYSTFMTIPATRATSTSDTKVVFGEAPQGAPPPIRVWFPAYSLTGYQFVYSHD
jgi:hypothetical protein